MGSSLQPVKPDHLLLQLHNTAARWQRAEVQLFPRRTNSEEEVGDTERPLSGGCSSSPTTPRLPCSVSPIWLFLTKTLPNFLPVLSGQRTATQDTGPSGWLFNPCSSHFPEPLNHKITAGTVWRPQPASCGAQDPSTGSSCPPGEPKKLPAAGCTPSHAPRQSATRGLTEAQSPTLPDSREPGRGPCHSHTATRLRPLPGLLQGLPSAPAQSRPPSKSCLLPGEPTEANIQLQLHRVYKYGLLQ